MDALRASSTAPCTCVAESWVRSEILDLGDALHIFQHLGDKPLVGIELPLGKGLLPSAAWRRVDGEEQHQSRQRNKPHTPVKEEHHRCDDAGGQKAAGRDHDDAG